MEELPKKNSEEALLREAERRFASFVPTDPENIIIRRVKKGLEVTLLHGAARDINVDGLTDRIVLKGIKCSCVQSISLDTARQSDIADLWWDPERQEHATLKAAEDVFRNAELIDPGNSSPKITLYCTLEALVNVLPTPGAGHKKQ